MPQRPKNSQRLRHAAPVGLRRRPRAARHPPRSNPTGSGKGRAKRKRAARSRKRAARSRKRPREAGKDRAKRGRVARSREGRAKRIGPHGTGWPVQSGKLCAERPPRPAGRNGGAVPAPGGNRSPAMPRHTVSAPRSRRPARTALRAAAESGWRTPQRIFSSSRALLTAAFSAFRAALASFRAIRFATRACSFPILSATRTSWRRSRTSPRTSRRS